MQGNCKWLYKQKYTYCKTLVKRIRQWLDLRYCKVILYDGNQKNHVQIAFFMIILWIINSQPLIWLWIHIFSQVISCVLLTQVGHVIRGPWRHVNHLFQHSINPSEVHTNRVYLWSGPAIICHYSHCVIVKCYKLMWSLISQHNYAFVVALKFSVSFPE